MKIKIYSFIALFGFLMLASCTDELNVQNPNDPTPESASTENGIVALAQGGVYINGFKGLADKYVDGVPGYFWSGAVGFHEIMGDVIGVEAANWYLNQIGCPDEIVLDDGTVVKNPQNPNAQVALLREINTNANQGQNPLFHEWANMYSLNNACNTILEVLPNVAFVNDGDVKKKTVEAWAYWWKGFAYSRIGSIYYAGVINSEAGKASNVFKSKEDIINEATANFDKAAGILATLQPGGAYSEILGKLIPDICQVKRGGVLTPAEWIRNINTYKARNILVNNTVAQMDAGKWNAIKTLTSNGIKASDKIFTVVTNDRGDLITPSSGAVILKATNPTPGGGTYKLSERLIQDFKTDDQRLANNFNKGTTWIGNADRGIIFNTAWTVVDGGKGLPGVITLSSRTAGEYELAMSGTYEENELMAAEAALYTGDVEGGLAKIDNVRSVQGAGLASVAGKGLSLSAAKEELRVERRCGLAFRGLSFYDARRWGVIDKGSGRTGAVVVDKDGKRNTNVTIRYNFLDYWDVPDNELAYNPAGAGSAPVKNPK
jgi:hypothetical protein